MRRLLLVLAVLSFAAVVNAQETPKYEFFGGYSFLRESATNYNGWEGSGVYNFNRWIGLKLDADGHYWSATTRNRIFSVDQHFHEIMVGPQFSWRQKRFTLFAHTLFGYSRFHNHFVARDLPPPFPNPESETTVSNGLGVALGGGGDWNLTKSWAVRAQLDYLQAAAFQDRSDNLRFSTGVVYRFGKR
jgi:opacity protein-like surface antigen